MAPSYCGVCSKNLDDEILNDGEFMIQCDVCETWYHGKCVELEEFEAADIDDYHCPSCISQAGPSKPKRIYNSHRYDYSDQKADNKPMENGTRKFIEELKKRKFRVADAVVLMKDGHSLTSTYLDQTNFKSPILVEDAAGLGMKLPPPNFSVDDVERRVGGDRYVDVVDVYTQHSYKMRLRSFLEFFRQKERPKLYNLISLEFSDTELSKLVKMPDVVEELSWVEQYWPKPLRDDLSSAQKAILNEHITVRPEVSKFCLIGMGESYTDFHIDFGGTSVFYHVLWGEKVFYLIEPSDKNIHLFENWQQSIGYSERFFGDLVSNCSRLVLKPGQTFFIPTGWIHAVYTPKDSLVIGGNFLHSFNIGLQIRIYEMEKHVSTAEKFMFPHFELMNWYAGAHLLEMMKELNEEKTPAKGYLLEGLKALVAGMKTWVQRNQSSTWPLANMKRSKLSGQIIIETMTCSQILKQLEKAVHLNEKLSAPLSTKPKYKKRIYGEKMEKIEQPLKVCLPSTSSKAITPLKIAMPPLPKLKVPSKNALEKSKGCPKSPAKIQQQTDEIVNAVAAGAKSVLKTSGKLKCEGTKQGKKDEARKSKKGQPPIPLGPRFSDGSSQGTDLDSAPPTPKWDDPDESRDRIEPKIEEREIDGDRSRSPMIIDSVEELEQNAEILEKTKPEDADKKVFGFSLLDMRRDDSKSPPMVPTGRNKEMGMNSPTMVAPLKLETRGNPEKSSKSMHQSTSCHGRLQKPSQRIVGKLSSSSKAGYYPDLGYCRQDEEFVYPSLSDSDLGDAAPRKRRRSTAEGEKLPKKSEGSVKMKLQLTSPERKLKSDIKRKKPKTDGIGGGELTTTRTNTESPKAPTAGATKAKKLQKGTTKQRLANKLKIRKLIPM